MFRTRHALAAIAMLLIAGCGRSRTSASNQQATYAPRTLVYLDEDNDRARLGRRARMMLAHEAFDTIEMTADSLARTDERWYSGAPKLVSFIHRGFDEVDDAEDAGSWERHLAMLRQWSDARPNSVWAPIALAEGLIARAWAARGHGYSNTVSKERWQRFEHDLNEARMILDQSPPAARENPLWYEAAMSAEHGLGSQGTMRYRALLREALRKFPTYQRFYVSAAVHLMPRWYGGDGELVDFMETFASALPDSIGDEFYARVAIDQTHYCDNLFDEYTGISWPRMRHGLVLWQSHWPRSTQPRNALAYLATEHGDRQLARQAFESLGDTLEFEIWQSRPTYENYRAWAFADTTAPS